MSVPARFDFATLHPQPSAAVAFNPPVLLSTLLSAQGVWVSRFAAVERGVGLPGYKTSREGGAADARLIRDVFRRRHR